MRRALTEADSLLIRPTSAHRLMLGALSGQDWAAIFTAAALVITAVGGIVLGLRKPRLSNDQAKAAGADTNTLAAVIDAMQQSINASRVDAMEANRAARVAQEENRACNQERAEMMADLTARTTKTLRLERKVEVLVMAIMKELPHLKVLEILEQENGG